MTIFSNAQWVSTMNNFQNREWDVRMALNMNEAEPPNVCLLLLVFCFISFVIKIIFRLCKLGTHRERKQRKYRNKKHSHPSLNQRLRRVPCGKAFEANKVYLIHISIEMFSRYFRFACLSDGPLGYKGCVFELIRWSKRVRAHEINLISK